MARANGIKKTRGERAFDVFNVVFFIMFGLITLYPFWSQLMTSFMDSAGYYSSTLNLIPRGFNLSAYKFIFSTKWIASGYFYSVVYTLIGTLYVMLLVITAAYGITKENLPGSKFINTFFLITMYFGGGTVPFYILVANTLHLSNTIWAVTITSGLRVWSFLVLRNYIKGIPTSLVESARIDGAGELRIMYRIIMPLAVPTILTLTMFTAIGFWNEYFRALLFIDDQYKYPLQMVVRKLILDSLEQGGKSNAVLEMQKAMEMSQGVGNVLFTPAVNAAVIMAVTLPIIVIYPFIQKYFDKGVLVGSIKG